MRKYWTKEEEDKLMLLCAQGKSEWQIANALKRSPTAIRHKRQRLGLTDAKLAAKREADLTERVDLAFTAIEDVTAKLDYLHALATEAKDSAAGNTANLTAYIEQQDALAEQIAKTQANVDGNWNRMLQEFDAINIYLSHGRLWRLFHSYSGFRRKLTEKRNEARRAGGNGGEA